MFSFKHTYVYSYILYFGLVFEIDVNIPLNTQGKCSPLLQTFSLDMQSQYQGWAGGGWCPSVGAAHREILLPAWQYREEAIPMEGGVVWGVRVWAEREAVS